MKKLLLFFCALLCLGGSGAWAADYAWNSGNYLQGDQVNVQSIGFKVPDGITTGSYYMALNLFMKETSGLNTAKSSYIGIFTSTTPSDATCVGISANKPDAVTSGQFVTYNFTTKIALTAGETYYLIFLENNDESYVVVNNRIGLVKNTYSPGIRWSDTNHTDYAPIYNASISSDALPIAAVYGSKSGTFFSGFSSTTSAWSDLWECSQFAIKNNSGNKYIESSTSYLGATNSATMQYDICALGKYKIKGYRLTALAETYNGSDCTVTITKPDATTATFTKSDGTTIMADVTLETAATSTYFKAASNNAYGRLKNVELVVYLTYDGSLTVGDASVSDLGVYNLKMSSADVYMTSASKTTTTKGSAARVQFISTGTANEYYLYCIDNSSFLSDPNPDSNTDEARLVPVWAIDANSRFKVSTTNNMFYIQPLNTTKSYCLTAWSAADNKNIVNFGATTSLSLWEIMAVDYDSKALIQAYMDADFTDNYGRAGFVGYPRTASVSYVRLKNLVDSINNTGLADTWRYNADMYTRLQSYYAKYLQETDITMPEEGKTYAFINFHPGGNKYYLSAADNGFVTPTSYTSGTVPETGQYIAHKLPDDKYFFVARKESNRNYHLHVLMNTAQGDHRYLTNGYNTSVSPITLGKAVKGSLNTNGATVTDADIFGGIYIKGTRLDGLSNQYIIISTAGAFNGINAVWYRSDYSCLFYIQEITTEPATESYYNTVNMRQAGDHSYASTYLPFAVQLPEHMKAYKAATPVENVMALTKVADGDDNENNVLPALTAAILYSDGAAITGNTTLPIVSSALTAPVDNALSGTLADNTTVSTTTYVLYGDASSAGFYPLNGTTAPTCKAYYDAGAAGVKSFRFDFGDITDGIKAISNSKEPMANSQIFNLAGQRISKLQRGVNIVNSKKVVVK